MGGSTVTGCEWERCPGEGADPTDGCQRVSHGQGHPSQHRGGLQPPCWDPSSPRGGDGGGGGGGQQYQPFNHLFNRTRTRSWSQGLCSSNGAGSEPAQEMPPKGAKRGGDGGRGTGAAMPKSSSSQLRRIQNQTGEQNSYGRTQPDQPQLGDDRSHPTADAAQPTVSHQGASPSSSSSSSSPCSERGHSREPAWLVSPSLRFKVYAKESALRAAARLLHSQGMQMLVHNSGRVLSAVNLLAEALGR